MLYHWERSEDTKRSTAKSCKRSENTKRSTAKSRKRFLRTHWERSEDTKRSTTKSRKRFLRTHWSVLSRCKRTPMAILLRWLLFIHHLLDSFQATHFSRSRRRLTT